LRTSFSALLGTMRDAMRSVPVITAGEGIFACPDSAGGEESEITVIGDEVHRASIAVQYILRRFVIADYAFIFLISQAMFFPSWCIVSSPSSSFSASPFFRPKPMFQYDEPGIIISLIRKK